MNRERKEAWFRIIVAIVTGIILGIWGYAIAIVGIINWFYVLIKGRRHRMMAEFCEYWNTAYYMFYRYLTSMSNERPFPFTDLKRLSKFR